VVTVERPPDHVLAAFGLSGVPPVPLGSSWEGGWRCGEVVDADGLLKIGHALRHLLETVLAKKLVLFLFKIFGHRIVFMCGD